MKNGLARVGDRTRAARQSFGIVKVGSLVGQSYGCSQAQLPFVRPVRIIGDADAQHVTSPGKAEQIRAEHGISAAAAQAHPLQDFPIMLRRPPHEIAGDVARLLAQLDQKARSFGRELLLNPTAGMLSDRVASLSDQQDGGARLVRSEYSQGVVQRVVKSNAL